MAKKNEDIKRRPEEAMSDLLLQIRAEPISPRLKELVLQLEAALAKAKDPETDL